MTRVSYGGIYVEYRLDFEGSQTNAITKIDVRHINKTEHTYRDINIFESVKHIPHWIEIKM